MTQLAPQIAQPDSGQAFETSLAGFQALITQQAEQLSQLEIHDIHSFLFVVDLLQAQFSLYNQIKLAEDSLQANVAAQYGTATHGLIGQIFQTMQSQLPRIYKALNNQPAWLNTLLMDRTSTAAALRVQVWSDIVDLANMAGRTSSLPVDVEAGLWELSDYWMLQMHHIDNFEPGLQLQHDGQTLNLELPVIVDWNSLENGSNYLRPYFRALSHRNFPQDSIDDTNAVDLMLQSGQIVAVSEGTVIPGATQFDNDEGGLDKSLAGKDNYVFIQDDATGLIFAYRHLAKLSLTHPLRRIQHIVIGQDLGEVGMTGLTSDMHLHFVVYRRAANGGLESLPLQLIDVSHAS